MLAVCAVVAGAVAWNYSKDFGPSYVPTGEPVAWSGLQLGYATRRDFDGMLLAERGHPVVVNVWASWCAPCRAEMPMLQKAADNSAGKVAFFGLATKDDPQAAQRFLNEIGVSYPSLFDGTAEIRVALGVSAFPTTYVFASDGTLIDAVIGSISEQQLAALIEAAST